MGSYLYEGSERLSILIVTRARVREKMMSAAQGSSENIYVFDRYSGYYECKNG